MFNSEHFNLMESLSGVLPFLAYFITAVVMTGIFTFLYTLSTPHDELKLIKENNVSAAISFVGALIGFIIPLTTAMNVSANIVDFVIWGIIALLVQIILFYLIRFPFPKVIERIKNGEAAMGILIAGISIAIGALNATAMNY
ncbi:hypothetical protein VA7868_00191 [Vibrio aerogenes CECT 7868]|uniref:Inner membrane protein YjfL n=1 Tax=Vibrio aerogenes CECT 7868 TaxID=1216006 RepID=A0A1M5UWL7_9VIBR|nr:DUF350 domain-containing protein [Vibrio aerogenes]SHH67123.1 hypothetical protein VA7868_00191 [Vibrio aerogenes CECT 7868]